ncbi:ParB/RepB/Spo0J family partition protein [Streptomyces lasiicapitis]|uniref:ParB/RepB/Spo0J family partition protein n=1 Tax=Streptomyces lasiicapitis TaxID=1923961 RepID=UPI003681C24C
MKYRGQMPTLLLSDDGAHRIAPTDFKRWKDALRQFDRRRKDRAKVDELKELIVAQGLQKPILLCVHEKYPDVYVSDGHHRAVALMELGALTFPFHWHYIRGGVRIERNPFPYGLLGLDGPAQAKSKKRSIWW